MQPGPSERAPIERYVVLEYLSEGGMGAIYLGKKLGAGGFEKEVVLKQLLPEFTQQPEFIDLFLREARLSATLDHANIIHTIDLVTAGSEYFIVMEYLAGADLRTLGRRAKRRRKQFSPAAGLCIAREVLAALAYAHAKVGPDGRPLRLIHRDVSPSNILVSRNGEVKLTDFGIAKAATHTSVFYKVKGKVGYMSPEQAKSEPMDHRSDLYSLAVCLYEIITGERLFISAGLTSTPQQIYGQPITLPSRKVPGLPPELDKVMLRALALDPAGRYQTAGELQEALLRCAHKSGLMMSAPELAAHLRDVCGPPEQWRDVDEAPPGSHTAALGRSGTEVYDGLDDASGDVSGAAALPDEPDEPERSSERASSILQLGRLQGLELTSMINVTGIDHGGARPLVDWGELAERADASEAVQPILDEAPSLPSVLEPGPPRDDATIVTPPEHAAPAPRRRWLTPVAIAAAVVLAALIAAAVIGLSGPEVQPAPPADGGHAGTARPAGDR